MKNLITTVIVLIFAASCVHGPTDSKRVQADEEVSNVPCSQTYEGFVESFRRSTESKFGEDELNKIFQDYSELIMTAVDTTALVNELKGKKTAYYGLEKLKSELFYSKTIDSLLHSSNPHQRLLGYITVASAGDKSFNDLLVKASKTESSKGGKHWAGMALLYLRDDTHASELFDFIVENENFADAHMIPFYLKLDKISLRNTAYEKINSMNPKARIFAIQSLAGTELNPKTDQIVRKAIKSWSQSNRGYAIYTAKELGMGNLKDLLSPLLQDESIREVSLEALANSPTPEDQEFLSSILSTNSGISEEMLNAYLKSNRKEQVRKWLKLVRDERVNPEYCFYTLDQPLLSSDEMLDTVRDTIRNTKNRFIVEELCRALEGRKDEESINLLISLLSDSNSSIRFWTAMTLRGNSSPQVIKEVLRLIRNPDLRTVGLTHIIIENKIDNLHDVYENLLYSDSKDSKDWYNSSLSYFAAFPRDKDKALFKSILHNSNIEMDLRSAAVALGQLKDETAVPFIAEAMRKEPPYDENAITYLEVLGKIKGEQSKKILESYKNSDADSVRKLVAELLANW